MRLNKRMLKIKIVMTHLVQTTLEMALLRGNMPKQKKRDASVKEGKLKHYS